MEDPRRPYPADPEFDNSTGSTVRLRDDNPLEHQRLVVNPFLAVFGMVFLGHIASWCFSASSESMAGAVFIFILVLPSLIHYHCLDCGHTGRFSRRDNHACPDVLARWREGRRSWVPFPSAKAQLVVWVWLVVSVGLLLAVLSLG